jgi:hypothetical protein
MLSWSDGSADNGSADVVMMSVGGRAEALPPGILHKNVYAKKGKIKTNGAIQIHKNISLRRRR